MEIKLRDLIANKEIKPDFLSILGGNIKSLVNENKKQIADIIDGGENPNSDLTNQLSTRESNLNELNELSPFLKIINNSAKEIFSDSLERMPSVFADDRDFLNKILNSKDINDLIIFLDCYGEGACFDHHSTDFLEKGNDLNVATNLASGFSEESKDMDFPLGVSMLSRLQGLIPVLQKKGLLEKEFKNGSTDRYQLFRKNLNDFIPLTSGYLDTDAILAHFAILYPKTAIKNKKLLDDASLYSDLNLPVTNKSVQLNSIIMGFRPMIEKLKRYYSDYIDIEHKEQSGMTKKDKKLDKKLKLAIFDTILGNAILNMVKSMIKYTNGDKIDENLFKLFSSSITKHQLTVDNKTEEISESNIRYKTFLELKAEKETKETKETKEEVFKKDETQKNTSDNTNEKLEIDTINDEMDDLKNKGLMKVKIEDGVAYFSYNKLVSIDSSGIPPESFYQYLRTSEDIKISDIKYCVICTYRNGNEISPDKAKSIFISNVPHGIQDLKTYSLRDKVFDLNELEGESLDGILIKLSNKIELIEEKLLEFNKEEFILNKLKESELARKIRELGRKVHKKENKDGDNEILNGKIKKLKSELAEINKGEYVVKKQKEIELNKKLKDLEKRKESMEKRIDKCRNNGLYHARNGFVFISTSYSGLEDVIDILKK